MAKKSVSIKIACSQPPGSIGHLSTTFVIDGALAIDAGALASGLELREQRRIRHVFLTHSHLDHLHELPQFLDNVQTGGRAGARRRPVAIHAEEAALKPVRRHLFNGLWPDVLDPAIGFASVHVLKAGKPLRLPSSRFRILPIRTIHRVPTVGFLFSSPEIALGIFADTGYSQSLLEPLLEEPRLRFLAMEVSYPNRLESWALDHGHLTPLQLARMLEPLRRRFPRLQVAVHHLKPSLAVETAAEIRRAGLPGRLRILRNGDRFFYQF